MESNTRSSAWVLWLGIHYVGEVHLWCDNSICICILVGGMPQFILLTMGIQIVPNLGLSHVSEWISVACLWNG